MSKTFAAALFLAAGLASAVPPAQAMHVMVTNIDKNSDGTWTYHFGVRIDQGEALTPNADFVTVYNFAGIVGSAKTPAGWVFSSEDFGRTPTWGGYPAVMPVDVPGLSNLTWTATRPVTAATMIEGFSATTRVGTTTEGEYTAQVTLQQAPVNGTGARPVKQALIGQLPTPSFLSQ